MQYERKNYKPIFMNKPLKAEEYSEASLNFTLFSGLWTLCCEQSGDDDTWTRAWYSGLEVAEELSK